VVLRRGSSSTGRPTPPPRPWGPPQRIPAGPRAPAPSRPRT